ncbi:MAG: hypothetical protein QM675_00440 [Protaetiibacter sp.]
MLVSHGDLAVGMRDAVRMLAGGHGQLLVATLRAGGGGSERYRSELREVLAGIGSGDELLVFADLYGGSPLTIALEVLAELGLLRLTRALGGMNLPMVLTAALLADAMTVDELLAEVRTAAREGIVDVVLGGAAPDEEQI